MTGLMITGVVEGSIAAELEIEAGDRLVSINCQPLRDVIDYNFWCSDQVLALEVEKSSKERWEIEVEREDGEPLGLMFAAPQPAECGNNCVFCFVHQLPRGLRRPLYVKDEDYRLSFLYGNYVTLTNITLSDRERIKRQRLSPLYISVHATDPDVREKLLGKKALPPILEVLHELAAARISMHCQVVLCPGINDSRIFAQTVAELAGLYPWVASVAVVPVGLTEHRAGLPLLTPLTREYAKVFVEEWEPKAGLLAQRLGEPFLFLADEFYIKGELPFPPLQSYGEFPQLENGVGMVPLFIREAEAVLERAEPLAQLKVTVLTGMSALQYLTTFLDRLSTVTGATLHPVAVANRLFGPSITVTGLVCGQDIISASKNILFGDLVLVPDVMLKEGQSIFLDDLRVQELEEALGRPVKVVEATPLAIYEAVAFWAKK